jgi:cytoskeletal protein CcmA (bactofilin family)
MKDFNLEGIGRISGGVYDTLNLEGVSSCSQNIKAEQIHIEGVFTCSGTVQAGLLYCEGVSDFKADIRAKKLVVEGVLNEKSGTKIEAEEISCDGVIRTGGEISADILKADGCVSANEIFGDRISIFTHYPINKIRRFFNAAKSDVKLIEATTIELSGVTAETVNGRDITIGPNCNIDRIDCSGTLFVDISSRVNTITGEYTRRDK